MAGRLRYAQVDLSLFGDPKVRRLFRSLDERDLYAAMGIWLDVLLSSWEAEGPTVQAGEVVDPEGDFLPILEALHRVGLLDVHGYIPRPTWDKWWASVEADRERWRKSKQRTRLTSDVHTGPRGSTGVHKDTGGPSHSYSDSGSPLPEERDSEGEEEGLDLTWNRLTGGRVPSDRQLSWLRKMEKEYGLRTAQRTMEEVYAKDLDADGLLRNTQDGLQARRNENAKREEDEREARERQARLDRSKRQTRELKALEDRASKSDPRPMAELMPDIAQMFGKGDTER